MLTSLKVLKDCILVASDGEVGRVTEFLFDDEEWRVRYLVVKTGRWLSERKVLISPIAVTNVDVNLFRIQVALTRAQVKDSPDVDTDQPVSRQFEMAYHDHFRWPYYWTPAAVRSLKAFRAGMLEYPYPLPYSPTDCTPPVGELDGDPHLRSSNAIRGYRISAEDRHFGDVEDLVVDLESWDVRYLVIDTIKFWPGNSVILAPQWVESIDRDSKEFKVKLTRKQIRNSPKYYTDAAIDREYEEKLYDYYGHSKYWDQDSPFHCVGPV